MNRRIIWFALIVIIACFLIKQAYTSYLYQKDRERKELLILGSTAGHNQSVREAQSCLIKAGLKPGSIDGILGAQTREAIKSFQKRNGLKPTGYMDENTWLKLSTHKPKKAVSLSTIPSSDKTKDKAARLSLEKKERTTYDIYKVQAALKKAGFGPGPIDGKIGKRTMAALRCFQKTKGLSPTGIVDKATWQELCKYF